MGDVDLRLELDRKEPVFHPGEEVRGVVHVAARREIECHALSVTWDWTVEGEGNVESGGKDGQVLFQGLWRAGEGHQFPFRFEAPAEPVTYQGELFRIDWHVSAVAEGMGPSARDSIPIRIVPAEGQDARAYRSPSEPGAEHPRSDILDTRWRRLMVAVGVLALAGGAFFSVWMTGIFHGPVTGEEIVLGVLAGTLLTVPGLVMILYVVRARITEMAFSEVGWDVQPRELRPGERLRVEVAFAPSFHRRIGGVHATVRATERATRGMGPDRLLAEKERFREIRALGRPDEVRPGEAQYWSRSIEIPRGSPATFTSPSNRVEWEVEVRVSLPWWPDWRRTQEIVVHPRSGGSGESGRARSGDGSA